MVHQKQFLGIRPCQVFIYIGPQQGVSPRVIMHVCIMYIAVDPLQGSETLKVGFIRMISQKCDDISMVATIQGAAKFQGNTVELIPGPH